MTDSKNKPFDCVKMMRQIRDQLSMELADLSYEERIQMHRNYTFSDPCLKRLSEKTTRVKEDLSQKA